MKSVTRVTSTRNPPLVTVDDNLISLGVEFDRGTNVGGVGTGDTLLSHGERRTSLAFEERFEPFLLLGGIAVTSENLCRKENKLNARRSQFLS